jgi:hypothetical protein
MEEKDTIIVFRQFDNAIDASIVKTKLDAYGIPCFLTEENFSNLYPSNHFITGGMRLHVFSRDRERVTEILTENALAPSEELSRCPKCHSKNVERDISNKLPNKLTRFFYTIFMMLVPKHRVNRCLDCSFEF